MPGVQTFRTPVDWQFILCDIHGNQLSSLTRIASNKHMEFILNRPAQVTFTVPSDNFLVNNVYIDPLGDRGWDSGTTYTVGDQVGTTANIIYDGTTAPYVPSDPDIPVVRTSDGRRFYAVKTSLNKEPIHVYFAGDSTHPPRTYADINPSIFDPDDDPNYYWQEIAPEPFLAPGSRTLKCYRREHDRWILRFFGYIWSVNDQSSDDNIVKTSVTCYDPFKMLEHRMLCDAAGNYFAGQVHQGRIRFPATTTWGEQVVQMIDRTNYFYGETGIETSTSNGAYYETTDNPPSEKIWKKNYVAQAIYSMCDAMLFDIQFKPIETPDEKMAALQITAEKAFHQLRAEAASSPAIFGLDKSPHNILTYTRSTDCEQLANHITTFDEVEGFNFAQSLFSRKRYRTHQAIDEWAIPRGLVHSFLESATKIELNFRMQPKNMVYITPASEFSAQPWDEFFLGDGIRVYTSARAREAIAGVQRVYSITLDIDDDGFEKQTEIGVSPN